MKERIKLDLTLNIFGELLVIEPIRTDKHGHTYWYCYCSCGNFIEARGDSLTNGKTRSCKCVLREEQSKRVTVHGDGNNPNSPYNTWRGIHRRCYEKTNDSYARYGGKGIRVSKEWSSYEVFRDWAYAHGWKKGLTIDRIDSKGDYSPDNCQVLSRSENTRKMQLEKRIKNEQP